MRGLFSLCVMAAASAAFMPAAAAREMTANELVTDCTTSMTTCNEDFVLNNLLGPLLSGACGHEDPLVAQRTVIDWISQHPLELDKDAETAVTDAKRALYSCM